VKLNRSLSVVLATWAALGAAVSRGIDAAGEAEQHKIILAHSNVGMDWRE
jgi:hypothetical protein